MIGVFDSGVGGMTVARAIEESMPQYSLVYFGDLARTPYGPKSPAAIQEYSRQNIRFLLKKGAKCIIIACNSASSVAADVLKKEFSIPIIEVVTPAVEKVVSLAEVKRIGIIGTRATIKSKLYEKLITEKQPGYKIFSRACPLLVPLVEEGWLNKRETKMIIRRYLHPLREKQLDALILGCTHYPILKKLINARIGKKVKIIDSSMEVAATLKTYLDQNPDLKSELSLDSQSSYYVSDLTQTAEKTAMRIFGRKIHLQCPGS
jgi:glutamate racemase